MPCMSLCLGVKRDAGVGMWGCHIPALDWTCILLGVNRKNAHLVWYAHSQARSMETGCSAYIINCIHFLTSEMLNLNGSLYISEINLGIHLNCCIFLEVKALELESLELRNILGSLWVTRATSVWWNETNVNRWSWNQDLSVWQGTNCAAASVQAYTILHVKHTFRSELCFTGQVHWPRHVCMFPVSTKYKHHL